MAAQPEEKSEAFKHVDKLLNHIGDLKVAPNATAAQRTVLINQGEVNKKQVCGHIKAEVDAKFDGFYKTGDARSIAAMDAKLTEMMNYDKTPPLAAGLDERVTAFSLRQDALKVEAKAKLDLMATEFKVVTTRMAARGTMPSDMEWKSAFQNNIRAFDTQINIEITRLKADQKAYEDNPNPQVPIAVPPGGVAPVPPTIAATVEEKEQMKELFEKQLKSLDQLKTKFKTVVEEQQNEVLVKAIKNARIPPAAPQVAAAGGAARAVNGALDNQHEMSLEILARHMRAKKLGFNLLHKTGSKFLVRDRWDPEQWKDAKVVEQYKVSEKGLKFTFTDDGIHFEKTKNWWEYVTTFKKQIGEVLDAYFILKGQEHGVLSVGPPAGIKEVKLMAAEVMARQLDPANPPNGLLDPPKPPTLNLDDASIDRLFKKELSFLKPLNRGGDNLFREDKARKKIAGLDANLRGYATDSPKYTEHVENFKIPMREAEKQKKEAKQANPANPANPAAAANPVAGAGVGARRA